MLPDLKRYLALSVSLALGLIVAGCAAPAKVNPPAMDAADFVRTRAEFGRQRLFLGYAGNGVFLGPAGDAAPGANSHPVSLPSIAFGDFWEGSARVSLLDLSLTPGPSAQDAYWQALDIDRGRAITYWQFPASFFRRGDCRVETLVTPEGVICWQVRSTGKPMRLTVHAPRISRGSWKIENGSATARLQSTSSEATISLRILPAPRWHWKSSAEGAVLQADIGREAFIRLAQQAVPRKAGVPALRTPAFHASFAEAAALTAETWSDFWAQSKVELPDRELMKWYRRSLYYLAATSANSAYPPGPMGPWPGRWGGRIFGHDLTYMHAALLSSNHPKLSGQFVEWYLKNLPSARRNARRNYGSPGARYGWEENWRGEECAPAPFRDEHHVNADIAWQAWRQAEWSGDEKLAERIQPLLRDTGEFLAAQMDWDEALHSFVSRKSTDLDETATQVAGAVATQAAAAWLAEICHETGLGTQATERIRGRVYLPQASTPEGSVLTAYPGDSLQRAMKHPSPLLPVWWLNTIDPDGSLAARTFQATVKRVNLDKTPTFNRPWLATVAAQMHDGARAGALLDDLLVAPGAILDDTCFAERQGGTWPHFLTTCGALVTAVNEMLLQSPRAGVIEVFPAVPAEWQRRGVSFQTLLTRGGVLVSGQLAEDEISITLRGNRRIGQILLEMPAPMIESGKLLAEVDGSLVDYQVDYRRRITIIIPASTKLEHQIRLGRISR